MSGELWLVRIVCAECGTERVVEEVQDDEHGSVWQWPPCSDHPVGDSRQICFCGDDETRCGVDGCSEGSDRHIAGPYPGGGFYGLGLCDSHLEAVTSDPGGSWKFDKHYFPVDDEKDAMFVASAPGGGSMRDDDADSD